MKERPILFSAPMVRALLDGTKTQTRRVVKGQASEWETVHAEEDVEGHEFFMGCGAKDQGGLRPILTGVRCPYGQPGDRLLVRETFYAYGRWETRYSAKKGRDEWHFIDMTVECDRAYQYAADNPEVPLAKRRGATPGWYKRPAIHMPRRAARTVLDVVSVRVERLQEISEADAVAEGTFTDEQRPEEHDFRANYWMCPKCAGTALHNGIGASGGVIFDMDCRQCETHVQRYRHLWESINGTGSWDANPWVWVVEFKRVTEIRGD